MVIGMVYKAMNIDEKRTTSKVHLFMAMQFFSIIPINFLGPCILVGPIVFLPRAPIVLLPTPISLILIYGHWNGAQCNEY